MKNKILAMIFGLAFLLLVARADAFANTFLENKTMQLDKWEVGKYCVFLQNIGQDDVVQKISVIQGKEFLQNLDDIDKEFDVPAQTLSDEMPVCMELKLPNNSTQGERYQVIYGVSTVNKEDVEKGMASFNLLLKENFFITEKTIPGEKPSNTKAIILGIGIFLAILMMTAVVFFVFKGMGGKPIHA